MSASINSEPWENLEIVSPRSERHYRDLPFHGFPHALETSAEIRVIAEDYADRDIILNEDELVDAEIGMLYHDAGFYVPIHVHHYKSKEAYASSIMTADQRELGMPEKRIQRIGGGILGTQLKIPPKTRVAKVMRQADLSNVTKQPPLQVVRNAVKLFREDEILKREYNHPGEIKSDLLSFVIGSYGVMSAYNQDDVSLGIMDRIEDGRSNFAVMLERGMECFMPPQATILLRKLGLLPDATEPTT